MLGLHIGISKRELLEDYYPDELEASFGAYNDMHDTKKERDTIEEVSPMAFFGIGGEG